LRKAAKDAKKHTEILGAGSSSDGFFGGDGLQTDVVRDVGEVALVGANCAEILGLTDEIEGAQGFPNLFVRGIDDRDFRAGCQIGAGAGDRANASGDWGANFRNLLVAVLQFGDQTALV